MFQDFQMAGNVPSWQNLGFEYSSCHENLRAAREINCAASPRKMVKRSFNKNAPSTYGGDCHAAIPKAAAAVTHVQSPSQVGSGDEGPGLYGHTYSKSKDQPGKVANPARGQLNRERDIPCPRSCLRIWSRETGSAVPSRLSLLISILRPNLVLTYFKPPYAIGVHYLF